MDGGTGRFLLDDVQCAGDELTLFECDTEGAIGEHDCSPFEKAGVVCEGTCIVCHQKLHTCTEDNLKTLQYTSFTTLNSYHTAINEITQVYNWISCSQQTYFAINLIMWLTFNLALP